MRASPFTGVLDGNDHRVSHLAIAGVDYVGLFGYVGPGAEVKDLGVVDVNITASGYRVGGLVGSNGGWGAGGTVTHCYSTGTVSAIGSVGGLVGFNSGIVTGCYSTSAVSSTGDHAGGLLGYNYYGGVTQCYSTGPVSGNGKYVGGLVGRRTVNAVVTDCFWDTRASGQATSAGGTGKTTVEMQTAQTFLEAGWDFVGETANGTEDIWWILEGKDYPRLWWEQGDEASP